MNLPKYNKITLFILLMVSVTHADIKLPSILGSHMVIQQNTVIKIWGWAEAGEKINVRGSWQKSGASTMADEKGEWITVINSPSAGGPYEILIEGKNKIVLQDILAGEVWVASGQSNMAMALRRCENAEAEITAADYPDIRLFHVERIHNEKPQDDCTGSWVKCTPQSVGDFSAVAYYFGRKLHKELDLPVGLISSSKGGSPAEAWMSIEGLKNASLLSELEEMWHKWQQEFPEAEETYQKKYKIWLTEKKQAEKKDKPEPKEPRKPIAYNMITKPHRRPGALYNAMIVPLLHFKVKGVIWYQGENNVDRPVQYRKLFPALIESWRADRQQKDMSFYYAQIAPFRYTGEEKAASLLREAQTMAMTVPNTGMAVTADIGNIDDIHPKNKKDVGERLALWALAKTYDNDKIVCSGPLYRSMQIENSSIRISFDYAKTGLARKGDSLTHFRIAGKDQKFYPANAIIEGSAILVSSQKVANPVAVRYGWHIATMPNLYNREGLPAVPFRTDDWD